jgi:hypothetical protein
MTRRTVFALAAAALTLTGAALAAATPGPHRALCPACYGLTEIAPGLWTDDAANAPALRRMAGQGVATVSAFFGTPEATPRVIFCQTTGCQDAFDIRPSAVTYGTSLILVAPKGINEMILTHELTHVALHRRQGITDILDQRFPAWFDEGLASLVSNDTRLPSDIPEAARQRIAEARHFWQWGAAIVDLGGWKPAYGAAMAEVVRIREDLGPDGLIDLIARVADGADFDAALRRMRQERAGT